MRLLRSHSLAFSVALLIAAPLAIYLPSVLHNGFVSLDDPLLITGNAAVQSITPRTLLHLFTSYDPELYIPLTLFTYQLEWAIAGSVPGLFHSTNLLLHIGSGLFLFFLLRTLFGSDVVAFFGALLFLVHPLHTETVAWAAARKDALSAFFFLGSLFFYERWCQEKKRGTPWWSVAFFLLALLSKVTVSLLPFVLLLFDWRRGEKITAKHFEQKIPYFALSVLFIVIALFGKAQGIHGLGLWKTFLLSCKAVAFTLAKLLWPTHLSVIYAQTTPVTMASPEFLLPMLIVIALCGLFLLLRKRAAWDVSVGLAFFLLTLLPTFANFWKNRFLFFASDRYAYLPSIGLILLLCALALRIIRRDKRWQIPILIVLVAFSTLSVLSTFSQSGVWRTDLTLYTNVLRWYPHSALAANNLGDAYVKAGKPEDALPLFARAVENDRGYITAMTNAGNLERERGRFAEAGEWYEKGIAAIGADPRIEDLAPRYLLGELLLTMGKTEEGIAQFRLAVETLPGAAEPHYNLAVRLHALGRSDEAIPLFEKAVSLNPDDIASRYHLAGLAAERGRLADAKMQLEYVVGIDPGYEKAVEHLGNIRRLLGK